MPAGRRQLNGEDVARRLADALPGAVAGATGEWVSVHPQRIAAALQWLHDDHDLDAAQLSNLCAVDRFDHFEQMEIRREEWGDPDPEPAAGA